MNNTVTRTCYSKDEKVPELIVCAAIKFLLTDWEDGEAEPKEFVLTGARHYSPDMHSLLNLFEDAWCDQYDYEEVAQGFITNKGRFVDRKEALVIAKANNQIIRDIGYEPKELYSEMLY